MRNGNLFKCASLQMCDSEIRVEQIHINQGVAVKLKENIVKNFLKILGSMYHGVQFKLLPARNK